MSANTSSTVTAVKNYHSAY